MAQLSMLEQKVGGCNICDTEKLPSSSALPTSRHILWKEKIAVCLSPGSWIYVTCIIVKDSIK